MRDRSGGVPFVLGIDLGAESIGWAMIEARGGEESRLVDYGVHTFDAAVDQEKGTIESGRDQSRAVPRREARGARRVLMRRRLRMRRLFRLLQQAGLLPVTAGHNPEQIDAALKSLDADLRAAHELTGPASSPDRLPYLLRARSLDQPLKPFELGRALYHLAQRRGFKSNRRSAPRKDEKPGEMEKEMSALEQAIQAAGARTLGEYLAGVNPQEEKIRRRHTRRAMFEAEFARIWEAQQPHHAALTEGLRRNVFHAMYFQHGLQSSAHLIGKCELEPGEKRAPQGLLIAQRFRLLQKVNDLLIAAPGEAPRPLNGDERSKLIDALERDGDHTFPQIRKLLGLKKTVKFNLERGDEKSIPGNRTHEKLRAIFGERWDVLSATDKNAVVDDVLTFDKEAALERRAKKKWMLTDEAARQVAQLRLESARAAFCEAALEKLVAQMETGVAFATAKKLLDPEAAVEPLDSLPAVLESGPGKHLRNPAVCRALTELRKLVNAIIRKHGKPDVVRIELARDLRNARKHREELFKANRERQKQREAARQRVLKEGGIQQPSGRDIEKALLHEECGGICPYTGKSIPFRSLFGANPEFDVEHIIPLSISLDNSFGNKTLCRVEENRQIKRNRTPFHAYGHDASRWNDILERVGRFKGDAHRKLQRFKTDDAELKKMLESFGDRKLNDTRYASRLAGAYVGLLYGGINDADGRKRVQVSPAGVTVHLRNELGLNQVLDCAAKLLPGSGGGGREVPLDRKKRLTHLHHAVDAVCVALASPAMVQRLSEAAERAQAAGRRLFAPVEPPWPTFLDDVRERVLSIHVSRRVNRRLRGGLHDETNYSKPHPRPDERGRLVDYRHVRKPVTALSPKELEHIVDPVIAARVADKLAEVGGKAAALQDNWPTLKTHDGREIPIKRVRIWKKSTKIEMVGHGPAARHVEPGENHHAVIFATRDTVGRVKWDDLVVSRLEAHRRKNRGERVVRTDLGPERELVMVLRPGDMLRMKDADGNERLYVVRGISDGAYELKLHLDARPQVELKRAGKAGGRMAIGPEALRKADAQKVSVSILGEVRVSTCLSD